MTDKLLLSICIPTYNRSNRLKPMLEQLLSCKCKDFEVVIQDNCSTDGTQNIIKEIGDSRVRLIENSENIGGIINGYGALLDAHGKYCMLCLDKDCILGSKLSDFLETLKVHPDVKYGICELNITTENDNGFFKSQKDCFDFFAYRGRHPSGMFWQTQLLKSSSVVYKILKSKAVFGFFPELIFAEAVSKETNGIFYKKALIVTETAEESAKKKTLTYDTSQIFFFPKNRIFEYKVYLGQLEELKIERKYRFYLKVFKRGLAVSTLSFQRIMQDDLHLKHYGITTRKIGIIELISIAIRYVTSVLFSSKKKSFNSLFSGE